MKGNVGALQDDLFLMEVRKVAKEISERCLRRWDSFLAVRAAMDSLGNSAGVWKRKFESVRSAVMLLAFRNVNAQLQMQVLRAEPGAPDPPGMHEQTCLRAASAPPNLPPSPGADSPQHHSL